MEGPGSDIGVKGVYDEVKVSRFQFKLGSKRRSKHGGHDEETETSGSSSRRHRSHKDDEHRHSKRESRRRHKHRHRSAHDDRHPTSTRDGTYYDPDYRHRESLYDSINNNAATSTASLPPDDAFRESLFDALADDEGAAYWEGVYGQPVHIYSDVKPGPDGKLERMSDEEYAGYVRTRMWEKSHQHIVQEREAKEKARQQRKQQRSHLDDDNDKDEAERETIRQRMAESLRRGEERKQAKLIEAAWQSYTQKWASLKNEAITKPLASPQQSARLSIRDLIPWPVTSGLAKDINRDQIERFFLRGKAPARSTDDAAAALLKTERVRWHPDKMQQRFGQHVDGETMALITAVFQVVDGLWNRLR